MLTRIPQIQTFTGKQLNFDDPQPDQIDIVDIAHALALTNRYGGHTCRPYSVGQHSIIASYVAPPHLAFEALMHDAQEAYIGDVPTTLKQLLPDFRAIEHRLEAVIRKKFGLPAEMTPEVKAIDVQMLATEAKHFGFDVQVGDVQPIEGLPIDDMGWRVVFDDFINRFSAMKP